jgi:hypothetical protein
MHHVPTLSRAWIFFWNEEASANFSDQRIRGLHRSIQTSPNDHRERTRTLNMIEQGLPTEIHGLLLWSVIANIIMRYRILSWCGCEWFLTVIPHTRTSKQRLLSQTALVLAKVCVRWTCEHCYELIMFVYWSIYISPSTAWLYHSL